MKTELTLRQRDILEFMVKRLMEMHAVPSIREIMTEFDLKSPNGVSCHFQALVRKGYVACREYFGAARGYRILMGPDGAPFEIKRMLSPKFWSLSKQQDAVLRCCISHVLDSHKFPTSEEIAKELQYEGGGGPRRILYALEKRGYVRQVSFGKLRGWKIVRDADGKPFEIARKS